MSTSVECDAIDHLKALTMAILKKQLACTRGPFLTGLDLELEGEVEEWVYTTREYLAERVHYALLIAVFKMVDQRKPFYRTE